MSTSQLPRGIDVASYQGYPDWAKVAASGITFAFTKVTEDTGYVNPTFAHNWAGIKAAGLVRGAYHFARPEGTDAVAEADFFLAEIMHAGGLDTGDMLALDLESGSGDLGPWSLAFLRRVEQLAGFKPIVYTGKWFTDSHNIGVYPELGEYGLWLAAYQASMPAPPAPWDVVAFWQHSSTGRVPGIVGDVDLNVFNGDVSRLAFYGKPGAVVTPPSPPAGQYAVGKGILDAMTAHGDVPATDEVYTKGQRDEWSEAFAASGARYIWLPSIGRVFRYEPAA